MKQIIALATAALLAAPLAAQESEGLPPLELPESEQPFFERWAEDMMKDLMEEIQPELESLMDELGPEIEGLFAEMVPRLQELTDKLGGLVLYELPEVLPNGDIIIRRKKDAPPIEIDPETNDPIEL